MLKKYLIVAVCFVVILCSALSVSAQTISGETYVTLENNNAWSFELQSADFIVTRNGFSYDGGNLSTTSQDNGVQLRLNLNSDVGTLKKGDVIDITVCLKPNQSVLFDSSKNVVGQMRIGVKSSSNILLNDLCYAERADSSANYSQSADNYFWESDWGYYCTYKFNSSSLGYSFDEYWLSFSYEVTSSDELTTYARYVYLADFEFTVQSQSDYEADKITQNQDENTDKILNGGKDYSNPDDTTINDYAGADAELNSQIESSRQESISFLNSFGSTFAGSKLSRGLLFVTSLFNEFIKIDWISEILFFALSLGAFSFVIGASVLVIGRVRQASHRAASEKYQSERISYMSARREYWSKRGKK